MLFSCEKEKVINPDPPANPYDAVNYGTPPDSAAPPDPNTITGIHKNIFSVKCANPGCHDGNFEPDFRTVMSSYNTLVYHKVVKYTSDSSFQYRVLPYNTDKSWLHERLVTSNATLGRMPLYANALTDEELGHINTWINDGAKDMFGKAAVKPDSRPTIVGFLAMDSLFAIRYDTVRVGGVYYNSFKIPPNTSARIIFFVEDDATAVENMLVNKMKLSSDKNNFGSSETFQAVYLNVPPYKLWIVSINTSAYAVGTTHFFRYYVNDGHHTADTEFPYQTLLDPYKTYFSFIVQ